MSQLKARLRNTLNMLRWKPNSWNECLNPMFKNILVPTDGSPLSEKAIAVAVEFAKSCQGRIVGLSVADTFPIIALAESSALADPAVFEQSLRHTARQRVLKIEEKAREAGVPCETTIAQSHHPHEEIIKAARTFGCDAIFMASHGRRGFGRLFVGSETQKVLAHSTIPVLIIR